MEIRIYDLLAFLKKTFFVEISKTTHIPMEQEVPRSLKLLSKSDTLVHFIISWQLASPLNAS